MLKKRPWQALVSLVGLGWSSCFVQAASLGAGASGAVLGQSLDFAVRLQLEAGETLTPDCTSAEVSFGERRLNAANLRLLLEPNAADGARLRVLSNQVVDEPVVTVQVSVGCTSRSSRRYVVLADPAALTTPPAALLASAAGGSAAGAASKAAAASVATAAMVPAFAAAPPDVQALAAAQTMTLAADGAVVQDQSVRRVAARGAEQARQPQRAQRRAERRADARSESRAAASSRTESRNAAQRTRRRAATAQAEAPRRPVVASSGPRLTLDFAPPVLAAAAGATAVDQALQAVAQAAAAARQQASAASAAAERIAALERTVDSLRGEAQANRDLSAQLREQLARTDSAASWTWPLAAAAVILATLAAWLGLRLAAARRAQQQAWQAAALRQHRTRLPGEDNDDDSDSEAEAGDFGVTQGERSSHLPGQASLPRTAPVPFVSSVLESSQGAISRVSAAPAWPPPSDSGWVPDRPAVRQATAPSRPQPAAQPSRPRIVSQAPSPSDSVSPMQATVALSQLNGQPGPSSRDMSIEELLDLEQQAEFFVVLGQDEAAIDLLVEHLRHTGGGSPVPYLKLLEIYRRRGDRSDYERTRARFNHRFNAYAPEWEADLLAGRALADYPDVLPRLQAVWARPLDSMAELEALLFRKSRGELFDLPAYREVLFLYALARDLLDRESATTGMVDLLLPLSGNPDFTKTVVIAPEDMAADTEPGHADFEDRPTAPIDLDLSFDNDRQASIFDPLEEQPRAPRRY